VPTATVTVRKNHKDGTVQTSVEGVAGNKCTEITAAFENAMGIVTNTTPTREMHEVEQEVVEQGL
jgi:hypothetical protein